MNCPSPGLSFQLQLYLLSELGVLLCSLGQSCLSFQSARTTGLGHHIWYLYVCCHNQECQEPQSKLFEMSLSFQILPMSLQLRHLHLDSETQLCTGSGVSPGTLAPSSVVFLRCLNYSRFSVFPQQLILASYLFFKDRLFTRQPSWLQT